jgi:DNA polymerase-4
MDSFFASVEQQANPKLVGRPIGVIKSEGRSCIIAASKEAKKLGIKTGTSTYEARKTYPKIIFVPANFDKYFWVTQKFIEICSRYSADLEVFSIDELFLDVTLTQALFGGVLGIVKGVKEALREEAGEYITCSIGISYNRLLAKLASDINKPNGVFEINKENRDEVLFSRKLSDVCGLGQRLEARLLNAGITNFRTLREVPEPCLKASFGPFWSVELKKISYGEDDSLLTRVGDIPKAKSVSRTCTLHQNTRDLRVVKATLRNLCEEAAFKTREMAMMGRMVGLNIRGERCEMCREVRVRNGDFRHKTLRLHIDTGKELYDVIWRLYQEMKWSGSVRFLGVWLSLLKPKKDLTLSLFPEEKKKENLVSAMDSVNKKYGELTVYPGSILFGEKFKSELNGFLGDKAYRFPTGF